jgi:ABC-type multidrug transport system fused ATPase/permease subunit
LNQDDIDESSVLRNDEETIQKNISIKIANASFSWGKEIQDKPADEKDKKIEKSKKKIAPIIAAEKKKKNKNEKKDIIKISEDDKAEKRNLLDEEEIKNNESSNETNNNEDKTITSLLVKDANNINNCSDTEKKDEEKKDVEKVEEKKSSEDNKLKKILKNVNFEVKKGELIAIVGEVGAGKSSLLQAILNNMIVIDEDEDENNNNDIKISHIDNNNKNSKKPKIIVNGEISYVSQISWIENDTLKNNVLFNQPYESEKYDKIIEISELKPDLEMLVGGDLTEIGEKGINLSGGQKARVSIARALYTEKDIYIFDDPISALDAYVGEKIMKKCILDYLKNKTRILVTHALQYLKFVDRIVILKGGRITWDGTYHELIEQEFYSEMSLKLASHKNAEEEQYQIITQGAEDKASFEGKSTKESLIEENLEIVISSRSNSMIDNSNKEAEEANEDIIVQNELLIGNEIESKDRKKSVTSKNTSLRKHKSISEVKGPMAHNKGEIKRITVEEDKEVGSVKWSVYFAYLKMMGGYCVFLIIILIVALWQSMRLFSDLYLTNWTKNQSKETNFDFYWKYGAISLGSCILVSIRLCFVYGGSLKTSRILHQDMLNYLVRAPINLFHDTIPKGQILNRISKDLSALDTYTSYMYGNILIYFFCFLGAIGICSYMNIWCLIFLPLILIVGLIISRFYMSCSRDLSRLDGIIRTPIINLLSATIPGASTIRAFHYEKIYKNKFYERVDEFYKVRLFVNGAQNWFGMAIDILSITFLGFLITFLIIFKDHFSSQNTGLMLTYYVVLQDNIFAYLSYIAYFENAMVSLERCLKYMEIPEEKPLVLETDKSLVSSWPSEGRVLFKNFSVKYRPDTEIILKNLNFEIKAKEKVGVVGRTGSGKSTLCLCLFRILEPLTGTIYIDDVDITDVGLKLLRNSITIIPQVCYYLKFFEYHFILKKFFIYF